MSEEKKDEKQVSASLVVKGCTSLSLHFGLIGGSKKMNFTELGLTMNLPQSMVGRASKKVLPAEVLKPMSELKDEVLTYLKSIGFSIHGIWHIANSHYDEAKEYLERKEIEFYELKKKLIMNIHQITCDWADSVDKEIPDLNLGEQIRSGSYNADYLSRQLRMEVMFLEDAEAIAARSFFESIADTAAEKYQQYSKENFQCKKRSCLNALLDIRKRLGVLAFVDSNASSGAIKRIDAFINSLPKTGTLEAHKTELIEIYYFFSNPVNIQMLNDNYQAPADERSKELDITDAEIAASKKKVVKKNTTKPEEPTSHVSTKDMFSDDMCIF